MKTRRFSVLVIDDSLSDRMLLRAALAPYDIEVLGVASGIEGIEAAQHHRPDAVVVDWHMPGLDGAAIISVLRANPRTRRVRIIVLTGSDEPALRQQAEALGVDDFIIKPPSAGQLATAVLSACGI